MDGDWCRQAADWHLYCTKEFFSEGEGSRAIEKMGDRFRGKTTTRTVGLDYGATDILCHPVPIRAQVSMVAGPQLGKIYCILLAFDRTLPRSAHLRVCLRYIFVFGVAWWNKDMLVDDWDQGFVSGWSPWA